MAEYVVGRGTESHNLLEHLQNESTKVIYIRHPSPSLAPNSMPNIVEVRGGDGKSNTTIWVPLPGLFRRPLSYFRDLVVTFYAVKSKRSPGIQSLFIGRESFCAFPGLVLKLRKIDGILDTPSKRLVVPTGNNFNRISRSKDDEINRYSIAYAGILSEGKGIRLLLTCLPRLVKMFPSLHLNIIGDGPLRRTIESELEDMNLKSVVTFYGYVPRMSDIEQVLATCGVGLALYDPSPSNYARYTDPAKPKLYLSCGLPVVITRVPPFASEIERNSAGVVIDYSTKELESALFTILNDRDTYSRYRRSAIELGSKYDWANVVHHALEETFSSFNKKL